MKHVGKVTMIILSHFIHSLNCFDFHVGNFRGHEQNYELLCELYYYNNIVPQRFFVEHHSRFLNHTHSL